VPNPEVSVTKASHLGNKGAKPRLLKAILSSDAGIPKNCKKPMIKSTPSEYQNVFITPDMKEQERKKQLRSQCNKEGRIYQIIKKNRSIVQRRQ